MKYNKSEIMKKAWKLFRMNSMVVAEYRKTFAQCLAQAWASAKFQLEKETEEAKRAAAGIRRMHYSEYKEYYSECETVYGSYDKKTKTIEVMTKTPKFDRRMAY